MTQPDPGPRRVATYADSGAADLIDAENPNPAVEPDGEDSADGGPLDLDSPITCMRQAERRDSHRVELDRVEVERAIRMALRAVGVVIPDDAVLNMSNDRGACFAWDVDSVLELEGGRQL